MCGIMLLGLFVAGCQQTPQAVVPCVTSIDIVDFNDEAAMKNFVAEAIPLGANEQCARRVLSGRKMLENYTEDRTNRGKNGDRFIRFEESTISSLRPRHWLSLGYGARSAYVGLTGNKVVKRGAN
jgi:hypothetical protein